MKKSYILLFFILIACSQSNTTKSDKIIVATSIFPISNIIQNITGDRADVFFVVPSGANPHVFEPKPSDVKKLQDVTLFIGISHHFDGWVEKLLPEKTIMKYLIDEKENINPHIWLSVKKGIIISKKITDYLISIDKKNEDHYKKNLHLYIKKLEDLDNKIAILLKNIKKRDFIQWHPAWDYFAHDYNLHIIGTIEKGHGDNTSIHTFKNLVIKAKDHRVKIITLDLNVQSKAVESLANEINGRIVRLDTIGDDKIKEKSDYIALMYYNAKIFAKELNRDSL